ncbi:hypothetical protein F5B19DRAFT_471911 [Rostrohypoxylon terebratum]|nr:hypothetical protein F5B19DRAFT_471911 [Rostrohypoxylon terebratum]
MFRVPWHRLPMIDAMERSRQWRRQYNININAERRLRADQPAFHHELIKRLETLREIQSHDIDNDPSMSTSLHEAKDENTYTVGDGDMLPTGETDDASRLEEDDDWEALAAAINAEVNTSYLDPRPKSKDLYRTTSLGESRSSEPRTLDQWLSIASDMTQEDPKTEYKDDGQHTLKPIPRVHSSRSENGKDHSATPQQLSQPIEPCLCPMPLNPEDWLAMSEAARAAAAARAESARRGEQVIAEHSRTRKSNQAEGGRTNVPSGRAAPRGSRRCSHSRS